ncbi:hypothetical protein RFI_10097, partial [Reticulomyxa filosa]
EDMSEEKETREDDDERQRELEEQLRALLEKKHELETIAYKAGIIQSKSDDILAKEMIEENKNKTNKNRLSEMQPNSLDAIIMVGKKKTQKLVNVYNKLRMMKNINELFTFCTNDNSKIIHLLSGINHQQSNACLQFVLTHRTLMEQEEVINYTNDSGQNAVHSAVSSSNIFALKLLFKYHGNFTLRDNTSARTTPVELAIQV